jgi:hypothetical protein
LTRTERERLAYSAALQDIYRNRFIAPVTVVGRETEQRKTINAR